MITQWLMALVTVQVMFTSVLLWRIIFPKPVGELPKEKKKNKIGF